MTDHTALIERLEKAKSDTVPLWGVTIIGVLFGFVAWGLFGVVCFIGSITIYGLSGIEVGPPSLRVQAFVFAIVFVVVTAFGLACWAGEKIALLKALRSQQKDAEA